MELQKKIESMLVARNYAAAEKYCRLMLRQDSNNVFAHVNLAYAMLQSSFPDLAAIEKHLRCALRAAPGQAEALIGLSEIQLRRGDVALARDTIVNALALHPCHTKVLEQGGRVFQKSEEPERAEMCYARALQNDPNNPDFLVGLANALDGQDKTQLAETALLAALKIAPRHELVLRIASLCPTIPMSAEEIHRYVKQITVRAKELLSPLAILNGAAINLPDIYGSYGFTSSRHAYYNVAEREIHELFAKALISACPSLETNLVRWKFGMRRKLRLGVATAFVRTHIVGQLAHGICAEFDRTKFEVIGINAPGSAAYLSQAQQMFAPADQHVILPPDLARSREIIAGLKLDVLLYLDTMMDPLLYYLCFARLAPVQCTTWGHPLTSGISNIDYFISAADWETPQSQQYYSEKLVTLEEQPTWFDWRRYHKSASKTAMGLPGDKRLYVCPQSLFKLHPDFDGALADILRQDKAGVIVLLHGAKLAWSNRIFNRIRTAAPDVAHRVIFVRRGPREWFMNLYLVADAVLDPFHWSGGNTTIEALWCGKPPVTLPGKFMRGRLSEGFYKRFGLAELIAATPDEYVQKNVLAATGSRKRSIDINIGACNTASIRCLEHAFAEKLRPV
jgi:protein O-GlcNAc transferase